MTSTSNTYVHIPDIVRATIDQIGYTDCEVRGFDTDHLRGHFSIEQSPGGHRVMGVDTGGRWRPGMMFGYAFR